MTSPNLAVATSHGRLYHKPGVDASGMPARAALDAGILVPSVTNVIDTLNKPFLNTWHAKEAALAAIAVNSTHPGLMETKPYEAERWLKSAAERKANAAAALGDEVHNACETLALGGTVNLSEQAVPYIDSWHRFCDDFQPEFLHLEATCFGQVDTAEGPLGYAGTADFIARINGQVFMSDYKTGRSIHTEAALQCSALAHAREIVLGEDGSETLAPMPQIDGGMVLHLTATGYKVLPAQIGAEPWAVFCALRTVWDFHQDNLVSRKPLFIGEPLLPPAPVTPDLGSAA